MNKFGVPDLPNIGVTYSHNGMPTISAVHNFSSNDYGDNVLKSYGVHVDQNGKQSSNYVQSLVTDPRFQVETYQGLNTMHKMYLKKRHKDSLNDATYFLYYNQCQSLQKKLNVSHGHTSTYHGSAISQPSKMYYELQSNFRYNHVKDTLKVVQSIPSDQQHSETSAINDVNSTLISDYSQQKKENGANNYETSQPQDEKLTSSLLTEEKHILVQTGDIHISNKGNVALTLKSRKQKQEPILIDLTVDLDERKEAESNNQFHESIKRNLNPSSEQKVSKTKKEQNVPATTDVQCDSLSESKIKVKPPIVTSNENTQFLDQDQNNLKSEELNNNSHIFLPIEQKRKDSSSLYKVHDIAKKRTLKILTGILNSTGSEIGNTIHIPNNASVKQSPSTEKNLHKCFGKIKMEKNSCNKQVKQEKGPRVKFTPMKQSYFNLYLGEELHSHKRSKNSTTRDSNIQPKNVPKDELKTSSLSKFNELNLNETEIIQYDKDITTSIDNTRVNKKCTKRKEVSKAIPKKDRINSKTENEKFKEIKVITQDHNITSRKLENHYLPHQVKSLFHLSSAISKESEGLENTIETRSEKQLKKLSLKYKAKEWKITEPGKQWDTDLRRNLKKYVNVLKNTPRKEKTKLYNDKHEQLKKTSSLNCNSKTNEKCGPLISDKQEKNMNITDRLSQSNNNDINSCRISLKKCSSVICITKKNQQRSEEFSDSVIHNKRPKLNDRIVCNISLTPTKNHQQGRKPIHRKSVSAKKLGHQSTKTNRSEVRLHRDTVHRGKKRASQLCNIQRNLLKKPKHPSNFPQPTNKNGLLGKSDKILSPEVISKLRQQMALRFKMGKSSVESTTAESPPLSPVSDMHEEESRDDFKTDFFLLYKQFIK